MGKIYLRYTNGVHAHAKQVQSQGYIELPDVIHGINIIADMNKFNEPISSKISQLLGNYKFYFTHLYISVGTNFGSAGIKSFSINGKLLYENNSAISVDDVGP